MPADALTYAYLATQLDATLKGGVVSKISMPYKDEIILSVRRDRETFHLLLSASPSAARMHLTEHLPENPQTAPAFLMHLRKHIGGAKVVGVEAVPYERIVAVRLLSRSELGDLEEKRLIAEIMGKYSNIILVTGRGTVSDSIKHITGDISGKRIVLPGVRYETAPPQDKTDIRDTAALISHLQAFTGGKIAPHIIKRLSGLAPATVNEAVLRAVGTESADRLDAKQIDAIVRALQALYDFAKAAPCLMLRDGVPFDFCLSPYLSYHGQAVPYASLSQAMDTLYYSAAQKTRFDERARTLYTAVKTALAHAQNKAAKLLSTKQSAADFDDDRICGELLTANLYRVKPGMTELTVDNYYTGDMSILALDARLSPADNAQRYYKRYAKKKRAHELSGAQYTETQNTVEYLSSLLASFALCSTVAELDQIRNEMETAGLVKAPRGKKVVSAPAAPLTFSVDGFTVSVGKNNLQNDALVRASRPDDLWLHTQKIHGSHVVIANGSRAPESVVLRAAEVCAYYSKARESENVPVDYTLVRYVSKPKGAPPGKVIYVNQKTVYVTPRRD